MSEPQPSMPEQIDSVNDGMKVAAAAIGNALVRQDALRETPRIETRTYDDGSLSDLEVYDITGQEADLNKHTQAGLSPRRNDGTTDLRKPLTSAPDGNGRSAIYFDDGKSVFFQDGVAYVFGPKDKEGNTPTLRQISVDEIPSVRIGARDSFWIRGLTKDGQLSQTNVSGKPIAVAIETLRQ